MVTPGQEKVGRGLEKNEGENTPQDECKPWKEYMPLHTSGRKSINTQHSVMYLCLHTSSRKSINTQHSVMDLCLHTRSRKSINTQHNVMYLCTPAAERVSIHSTVSCTFVWSGRSLTSYVTMHKSTATRVSSLFPGIGQSRLQQTTADYWGIELQKHDWNYC